MSAAIYVDSDNTRGYIMPKVQPVTSPKTEKKSSPAQSTQEQTNVQGILQRLEVAPTSLRPADVQRLQRTIGNRATERIIQAKLKLGPAGDAYEQEADRVAKQVVRASRQPKPAQNNTQAEGIQRDELDEELMQAKPLAERITPVQRAFVAPPNFLKVQRDEMEDEELQASPNHGFEGGDVDTDVARTIASAKGGGQPLHDGVRSSMEQGFGADFGGVRVHTGGQADELNRSLNARAFTTGSDIFFGKGQYDPGSTGGQELIAHELTHTVQQGAAGVQRSTSSSVSESIQRQFDPVKVSGKSHLRAKGNWKTQIGFDIPRNTEILADQNTGNEEIERGRVFNTNWVPAINVGARHNGPIPGTYKGYIRKSKLSAPTVTMAGTLKNQVDALLYNAEQLFPHSLAGKLVKDEHSEWLVDKALRHDTWNSNTVSMDTFLQGFQERGTKLNRIRDGANYVARGLEYWRRWLYPERSNEVTIDSVNFVKSDLHEEGLGVIRVSFTKPLGPDGHKFEGDTHVSVMIKPEDKSLEENLLGDKEDSAANQINRIAGLVDPDEMLTTIKMQSTQYHGSLVELAPGRSAEKLTQEGGDKPIKQAFHETLAFVMLAGIDDLHRENVFWDDGKPYLIDADNVLSYAQMTHTGTGVFTQSGFGGYYSSVEAKRNKTSLQDTVESGTNTVRSKIIDVMLNDAKKRNEILQVIKGSARGKEGRAVPIATNNWGRQLRNYISRDNVGKNALLDTWSHRDHIVREGMELDRDIGLGLFGIVGKNADDEFYDQAAERAQIKHDFEAGVIPFYVYHYDSGHVTHNDVPIYHGQTLEQAMQVMADQFDPKKRFNKQVDSVIEKMRAKSPQIAEEDDVVGDDEWDD